MSDRILPIPPPTFIAPWTPLQTYASPITNIFSDMEDNESSISSNTVDSDLPGRLLGNLYSFLGRHSEIAIGKTAERMGYGPRVVADRIRRRGFSYRLIRTYIPKVPG